MSSSLPLEIAETIQTASIKRHPSPSHDLNPSTAASQKEPVKLSQPSSESTSSLDKYAYDDEEGIDVSDEDEEDIPYSVLKPVPRRQDLGPLPDMRFEQSYLASIEKADTVWKVAYITVKDQVLFPLVQGMIWSLALHGWRHWNKNAQLSGSSVGAKVRRWWYNVNDWKVPDGISKAAGNQKLADEVGDFYQAQNSSD